MKKVALIGAGGWGATHFRNWMRLAEEGLVTFAAVCDVKEENLAEAKAAGIPCFLSDTEMYETVKPDLVSIAAGIPFHLPLVQNAVRHHAAVLLEKPAAATSDEVEQMIFLEQAYGLPVRIAFQLVYAEETRLLKQEILRRGCLESVTVRAFVKRDDAYYARNRWAGRITDPASGKPVYDSPLSNAFAHYLNLALFCASPEWNGSARAERLENVRLYRARPEIENFDVCSFTAYTRENVKIDLSYSHAVKETEWPNIRFHFSDGSPDIFWTSYDWTDGTVQHIYKEHSGNHQYTMFRNIATDAEEVCTLQAALEHTRCVELVQRYPVTPVKAIRHENYWEAVLPCGQ